MKEYSSSLQVRWSDLDPNFHVRHSVYYDWGAQCRVAFLDEFGLTAAVMQELHFGPILFREECVFRREIRSSDDIRINLRLIKARQDYSRWSIQHEIIKDDDTVCAVLTVDGAWMDVVRRKLASPPEKVHDVFLLMPKGDGFEWI